MLTRPVGFSVRPGRLIRRRHHSYNGYRPRPTARSDVGGTNQALPPCPASSMLHARFRHPEQRSIIENWVNSVIGESDRRQIFGRTAVERAKKKLQVRQYEDHDVMHSGELRLDGSELKAFIRAGQSAGRKMFTMAHELAHAALYRLDAESDQDHDGTERLCDLFAVEMTMPMILVQDIWRKTPDARAVAELVKTTKSSAAASCLRVAEVRGDAASGLLSTNGHIKTYGADLGPELYDSVMFTFRKAPLGTSSWILPNGLTVSTHTTGKRTFFLARRTH